MFRNVRAAEGERQGTRQRRRPGSKREDSAFVLDRGKGVGGGSWHPSTVRPGNQGRLGAGQGVRGHQGA